MPLAADRPLPAPLVPPAWPGRAVPSAAAPRGASGTRAPGEVARAGGARAAASVQHLPLRTALVAATATHAVLLAWLAAQAPVTPPAPPAVLSARLLTAPQATIAPPREPTVPPPDPVTPAPKPVVRPQPPAPPPLATPERAQPGATTVAAPAPEPALAEPAPAAAVESPAPAAAAAASVEETAPRFDAAYLDNPKPRYPPLARRLGEEGRVLLRVTVAADGTPTRLSLAESSGSPRLDTAAEEAVRRWRFVPARRGAEPVMATVLVPISFSLKD
jgi:protein TonB